MAEDRVLLGIIREAHGLRGEVKLKSFTSVPDAIASYGPLQAGESERRLLISNLKPSGTNFIARIEGVADRETAESLKGLKLYVRRDQLPDPQPGSYYLADLEGLKVQTGDGRVLGNVVSVENYGAGDLLQVKRKDHSDTVFIPFAGASVDLSEGLITVTVAEGLLDED